MDIRPPLYVVRISGATEEGATVNGTGFLVTPLGHVATCRHVICPVPGGAVLTELKVHLPYPYEKPCAYQVCGLTQDDIALLESSVPLAAPTPQALLHADWRDDTHAGDLVTVWGHSASEYYAGPQRFDCTISGFSEANGRIGLNGDINPGDSGAPVLNATQQVIGIAQVRDPKRSGQAMAIPVSMLRPVLAGLDGMRQTTRQLTGDDPVFLAPKPPVDHNIVGREQLLAKLKQTLVPGGHLALCFRPGVGKSALAIALANDTEVQQRFPDGVLWATLNLHPNILTELKKWGIALGIPADTMHRLNSVQPGHDPASTGEVEQQWAEAITRTIGERRLLLVIDDAWDFAPAQVLALNASNCAHLVTTREKVKVAERFGKKFSVTVVDELNDDDGMALLQQLAPNAVAMFPDKVRDVAHAVGGLPQGLLLLGIYLGQMSASGRSRRVLDAFANIREHLHEHLVPLDAAIRTSYEALPSDAARRALQVMSTFRPKPNTFTEEAALALLDGPARLLDDLDDSGLIETVSTIGDTTDPPYTMHRTIAEYVRGLLPEADAQALHRRAAAYFRRWLHMYDQSERPREDYLYQYRYEEPAWQTAMDEYLYHLARSGEDNAAALAFAEIYFDAFWWWGCYVDFPFCTRLLKQASLKRLSPEARHALDVLVAFDNAYPKETERTDSDRWSDVATALAEIRRLGKLDGDPVRLDEVRRHMRAVTDFFLAESFRFGCKDDEQALSWYRDAAALFPDDDWSKPWVWYHIGDTYLEQGQIELALRACCDCLAMATGTAILLKERDNEIIANAYRLRGEAALCDRKFDLAFDSYRRAALHAYAFQAIPVPPDSYTAAFYRAVTQRITRGLIRLFASDAAQASRFCSGLIDYWASYRTLAQRPEPQLAQSDLASWLRDANVDALCSTLFPLPPSERDLHVAGSPYFNEAITVFNEKIAAQTTDCTESEVP